MDTITLASGPGGETTTFFVAADGSRWGTSTAAAQHDARIAHPDYDPTAPFAALSAFTTIAPVAASGPGALDGFEIVCAACGDVQRYSLRTIAEAAGAAHLRFHARKAGSR